MSIADLWVPRSTEPLADLRAETDAERAAFAQYMRGLLPETRRMNDELRRIDPYLELVFVGDRAPDDDPTVIPGRWHVVRHNPGAPDTWMPVVGDNGAYAEPTSRIFEKLAEGNMWSDDYGQRARKRQARAAAEKERDKETRRRLKAEELHERVLASTRTFVSMDTSSPWTQNQSANSRRDQRSRKEKGTP